MERCRSGNLRGLLPFFLTGLAFLAFSSANFSESTDQTAPRAEFINTQCQDVHCSILAIEPVVECSELGLDGGWYDYFGDVGFRHMLPGNYPLPGCTTKGRTGKRFLQPSRSHTHVFTPGGPTQYPFSRLSTGITSNVITPASKTRVGKVVGSVWVSFSFPQPA